MKTANPAQTSLSEVVRTGDSFSMRSSGEAEGPGMDARSEPRAHNLSSRPRRHYRLSRTPPTIVRRLFECADTSQVPHVPDDPDAKKNAHHARDRAVSHIHELREIPDLLRKGYDESRC